MAHLEENETIRCLLSLSNTDLDEISNQKEVLKDSDNLIVSFDIIYNNHKGTIIITYNSLKDSYGNITLDIDFNRPAGNYNYPQLDELASRFMEFANY